MHECPRCGRPCWCESGKEDIDHCEHFCEDEDEEEEID